jgi:ribosome-binding factor A
MKDESGTRLRDELQRLAAEFINYESNRLSMITVTGVFVSDDKKKATVFCSVYPKEREAQAIDFLKRKRTDFRDYLKKKSALSTLPFIDFAVAPELPEITN